MVVCTQVLLIIIHQATVDDGPTSCILNIPGCTDSAAVNYNEFATLDNGTCFILSLFLDV